MAEPMGTKGVVSEGQSAGWGIAVALVLLAVLLPLTTARRQPPDPKPQDAPAAEFSAGRAREVLRELLGDDRPHPTGSEANAQVRDRILARLRGLGYTPEVQEGFACRPGCARVENVLARLPGSQSTGTILLMAHYDSVGAGPGASDDMAGVAAVLEAARVLKAGPPPKNTVLFLLDDGEEAGLVGAKVFAESPAAREVKVVVNLEARGSSGPSLMFETSGDDGWLIPLYAAGASRPVTSSVFATIYDLLPNDTDLTIFKQRGVHGLNFAYVGNPTHYHTAQDNFENASPASLQHHGDNALAAVRGLGGVDLASPPPGDAVFFDVLGSTVVHWPKPWTLGIALLALVLILAVLVLCFRRRLLTGGGVSFGLLAFLGSVFLAGVVAFGLTTLLRATPTPWVAKPLPVVAAFWLLALAATGFVMVSLARRAGLLGLWAGTWLGWAVFGVLLALSAPGLSYLFLIPAIVAGLAGLFGFRPESGATTSAVAVLLPLLVAAILWFPVLTPLYDGLGTGALAPIAVLLALLLTALGPLFAGSGRLWQRGVPLVAAVAAVILFVVAMASPPFSPSSPRALNVEFHQDADTGKARWLAWGPQPLPAEFRQAAAFSQKPEPAQAWAPFVQRPIAPAPPLAASAPELTVVSDVKEGARRVLRVRVVSPRGAPGATVMIPEAAKVESITVQGQRVTADPPRPSWPGWFAVTLLTLPPEGTEIDVVLGNPAPQDWHVLDRSPGLPPSGAALQKARPADAATSQDGDTTAVSRKMRI